MKKYISIQDKKFLLQNKIFEMSDQRLKLIFLEIRFIITNYKDLDIEKKSHIIVLPRGKLSMLKAKFNIRILMEINYTIMNFKSRGIDKKIILITAQKNDIGKSKSNNNYNKNNKKKRFFREYHLSKIKL